MQPLVAPPSHAILHSADFVRLIAAYVPVNDLLTASTLSRALHVLFDSEAAWQGKLRWAEAVQHIRSNAPVTRQLSSAVLHSIPPLSWPLSELAELCLQALIESDKRRPAADPLRPYRLHPRLTQTPPRITAIVHLSGTVRYHTRVSRTVWREKQPAEYYAFRLTYSEQQRRWVMKQEGDDYSGWMAVNVDDNMGQDDVQSYEQPYRPSTDCASLSSKQRYIELLQCSEHCHNLCHRLLRPTLPLSVAHSLLRRGGLSPVCPLPLCTSCRTLIVRYIPISHLIRDRLSEFNSRITSFAIRSVTRISATLYETFIALDSGPVTTKNSEVRGVRLHISHPDKQQTAATQQQSTESDEKKEDGAVHGGYEVVEQGLQPHVYECVRNVCQQCGCGLTRSGRGHAVDCEELTQSRREPAVRAVEPRIRQL